MKRATTAAPAPAATRRLPALDVLRGIAILGTLLTNIWIFAAAAGRGLAFAPGDDPAAGGAPDVPVNWATELSPYIDKALNLVTDGKFIGLLTIMFGIGLEIQRQSAIRRGEKWPGRYPWRAGLLVLDGLLNYIFIFEFDVLMGYGLTGLVVAAVMAKSPKVQKIWMGIGITAHIVLLAGMDVVPRLLGINSMPGEGREMRMTPEEFRRLGGNEDGIITEGFPDVGNGGYWDQVASRLTNFIGGRGEIPVMFIMGMGLFLVGAHLYRAGIFEERGAKLRKWTMLLSFGIGLPIDWGLRLFAHDGTGAITRYGTSSMVAFGVLALVAEFYVRRARRIEAGLIPADRATGRFGHALSLVGRMALTCYIGQNLIASIIFYDWGFGVSKKIVGQYYTYWTLLIYLGIAAFLVAFCALWLRRFPRGPVELVWHKSFDAISDALDRRAERKKAKQADEPATGKAEKAAVATS